MIPNKTKISAGDAPLLEAVFGEREKPGSSTRRRALLLGLVLALSAHAGLYLVARAAEPSLETWTANVAALVHGDLANDAPTEIGSERSLPSPEPLPAPSTPPTPEPKPPAPQAKGEEPKSKAAHPTSHESPQEDLGEASSNEAAAPSQAGEILAAEEPNRPIDFTDNTFVTGAASAFVGGATASTKAGKKALTKEEVEPGGTGRAKTNTAPKSQNPSKARPVHLSARKWRCAWPKAALSQDIYEQYVVLRVRVSSNGTVESATLESDPGHGFGAAAIACAKHTSFSPALNDAGAAVTATSPPIRVRFTR